MQHNQNINHKKTFTTMPIYAFHTPAIQRSMKQRIADITRRMNRIMKEAQQEGLNPEGVRISA